MGQSWTLTSTLEWQTSSLLCKIVLREAEENEQIYGRLTFVSRKNKDTLAIVEAIRF